MHKLSNKANNIRELIGGTDLLKLESLSKLTNCHIYVKCEFQNPGGSIKDRAALRMVTDAISSGQLKPGMTIVEGTAGNTGIGLSLVARSLGYNSLVVMPKGQAKEKERMVELYGGTLHLVDPCPFSNPKHFYHTAKQIAKDNPNSYWWADQFENLSNYAAHFDGTGPEIWQQAANKIDYLVAAAGTGGTIAGTSSYLKSMCPEMKVVLVDPEGSGLKSYIDSGHFESHGSSFTEGIGIMRLVENFKKAKVDQAITISDDDLVCISRYVKNHDGLVLGSSSALNVAGAFYTALNASEGNTIVSFACDLGERSYSKLYNDEYLASRKIYADYLSIEDLIRRYQNGRTN
jgi:cysteine synthase A